MAIYTGTFTDCGLEALAPLKPEIHFRPVKPAYGIGNGRLVASRPRKAELTSYGKFAVDLIPSEELVGGTPYRITARWLSEYGEYQELDLFEFFARSGGGTVSPPGNGGEWSPAHVFWQPERPNPWPTGWIWVNSITGDVNRMEG